MCQLPAHKIKHNVECLTYSDMQRDKVFCRWEHLSHATPQKKPKPTGRLKCSFHLKLYFGFSNMPLISWAAICLLFISLSPPLRKSKTMFRVRSMPGATPKIQANTFPPPPSNLREATAGTVLHWLASCTRALASALSVKLQEAAFKCTAPEDRRQTPARLPLGRVRWCSGKTQPEKDLERQAVRKAFAWLGMIKSMQLGFRFSYYLGSLAGTQLVYH